MRSRGTAGGGYGCLTFHLLAILASLLSALVAARPAAAAVPDLRPPSSGLVQVIVRAGDPAGAEALVERLGGHVVRPLPIIGGFAARMAGDRIAVLERSPLVRSVSPDARVSLAGEEGEAAGGGGNPLAEIADQIGVDELRAHGLSGAGVDIALIDSGVLPVPGMATILHGPDLSFESQNPDLAHLDTFGHGTHLAGIIAGHHAGGTGFGGIAPGARIISIKVADAFGATDVSQVIAAIDWVVQHRQTDGLNIRVLNLAFGTDSSQAYRLDPLAYAVEVAWTKGIVVVVSAGNSGGAGLTDPAYDPFVIAVGAADTSGAEADGTGTTVPDWSSRGDGVRNPDIVAPGVGIVSLRAPGSFIDEEYPHARVPWPLPAEEVEQDAGGEAAGATSEPPSSDPTPDDAPVVAPSQGEGEGSSRDETLEEPALDPPAEPEGDGGEPPADPPPSAPEPPADPPAGSDDPPADPAEPPLEEPPAEEPPAEDSPAPAEDVGSDPSRYFRGSGTSQAAAIVSGVVALMLEERRWLTPNKVKAILMLVARPITGDRESEGAGLVAAGATRGQFVEHSFQPWRRSSGTGSLEAVRGSAHVVDPDGVALAGEQDIFGRPWDGSAWALASAESRSWTGGSWNGSPWAGVGFEGTFWALAAWDAPAWSARSWAELSWSGRRWSGEEWTGDSWWSNGWSGRRWTSAAWMATWTSG
jgi:serine protease AprX